VQHPWEAGDFVCVPFFAWHKHFVVAEDQELMHMAVTTGPFGIATGLAIYESEEQPEYWVYAQEGEEAQRTLIPGGAEVPAGGKIEIEQSQWKPEAPSGEGPPTPHELYYEQLSWAVAEEARRRAAKVVSKWSELRWGATPMGRMAYAVHPRLGFYTKVLSTAVAEIPPGRRSGAHRHTYEETNYVLSGEGYAIIEDRRYDFKSGDVLVIPVFAWHQYFNTGSEPARFISHTNRAGVENTGYAHTQQGEPADY
jgi:gentisate 1,2-dioxygenase